MGQLTRDQINHVLQMQTVGRLGVINGKVPYVVPIVYVFDGTSIYGHSREGLKITLMRKNKLVCFQVDQIDQLDAWRSVLVQAVYQELKSPKDIEMASKQINDRFGVLWNWDVTRMPVPDLTSPERVEKPLKAVYFRLKINDSSGRYEKIMTSERTNRAQQK